MLYAVPLVLGIGETLFDTSAQSLMPSIVEKEQLSRANGRLYAVELTMNQFIGPPLGGFLIAYFGPAQRWVARPSVISSRPSA